MKSARSEIFLASALVLITVLTRFLPHPPNFSPVLGLALFSGAIFSKKSFWERGWAFFLPLATLFLSDLVLGWYEGIAFVYWAYALTIATGLILKKRTIASVGIASLASSVVFFLFSNLGVWMFSGMYPPTSAGLVECYVMAVPFFHNTLISTVLSTGALFGIYALAGKRMLDSWAPSGTNRS